MKPFASLLAVVGLAACGLAAHAEPVTVAASATVTLLPFGAGSAQMSLQFAMDSQVTAPLVQSDAFVVEDLIVQFSHGAVSKTITDDELGWFDYNGGQYAGIDFRLRNVLVQGDMLQFIWVPGPVFSGPPSAPTLSLVSLGQIGGQACYYATGSGACTADSYFSDGQYSVSGLTVAEPSTLALLPLALGLAAGAVRRRTGA